MTAAVGANPISPGEIWIVRSEISESVEIFSEETRRQGACIEPVSCGNASSRPRELRSKPPCGRTGAVSVSEGAASASLPPTLLPSVEPTGEVPREMAWVEWVPMEMARAGAVARAALRESSASRNS